jgi:hypothetical protein
MFCRLPWIAIAAAFVLCHLPTAKGQTCVAPPGAVRVNGNYTPDPNGDFYLITQYADANVNGKFDFGDSYSFTDPSTGQPVQLADPSVMAVTSSYGTWFYITGTSSPTSNFSIWRTQDFVTLTLHMRAFEAHGGFGSGQKVCGDRLAVKNSPYIYPFWQCSGDVNYERLWSPQIYVDPTEQGSARNVYLSFTAAPGPNGDTNYLSCFVAKTSLANFLAWHNWNPNSDGPRFADQRSQWFAGPIQWYHYTHNNTDSGTVKHDGGYSLGRNIPCSGDSSLVKAGCGWLELRNPLGLSYRCHGAAPWIFQDSGVYFDPNRASSDPWKRVLLYNWQDASWSIDFNLWWGNHIASHPLAANQVRLNNAYSAIPVASNRNTNNKVGSLDNGAADINNQQWEFGAVAEGATAIYLPDTDRYYLFYARNYWASSSYQIVYRMTEPGQPFSSLILPGGFLDRTAQEYVLLRSSTYTTPGGRNFGGADAFMLRDDTGVQRPYLMFHVKLDHETVPGSWTGRRTIFVKELTVENPTTGRLRQLHESHADPRRDIRKLLIPRCRQ